MKEEEIRLDELVDALKKRWIMIATITLVVTLVAAAVSFFVIKPKYEASTKVFIGKDEGENQAYSQNDVVMYQKLMKTYSEAIKTRDLINRALDNIDIEITAEDVLKNLTVTALTDTQILKIQYESKIPEEAQVLIEKITDEFIKTSKDLVPNGNIQIIEKAQLPEEPVSPNKTMNIAIAFLLGLMVSVGLAFLLEFLDNTFKSKDQLERELDIPVIGVIPTLKEN